MASNAGGGRGAAPLLRRPRRLPRRPLRQPPAPPAAGTPPQAVAVAPVDNGDFTTVQRYDTGAAGS